jgi:adenine-specific DNA-methyltransferase
MPKTVKPKQKQVEPYEHHDKERLNNPPVGLVSADSDQDAPRKTYAYDPHLDPSLQWAGKAERTSFEVSTVSLHVHERIDPRTIIEAVRRREEKKVSYEQLSLFHMVAENPPLRDAIEFYKHKHGWSNRLIAGDSLLVMNSLLEKEGLGGQVQMIYIDPPYGIKYGSNFQPFVNKRDVKDGKDEDLNQEPEMIKAFRDTWELGIHSYLTYLRDRLLLARELLTESGSIFVQISDENIHIVRVLLDEIFGVKNFVGMISFQTKFPLRNKYLPGVCDYILWYGKDFENDKTKYRPLFEEQSLIDSPQFSLVELPNGEIRTITDEERHNPNLLPKESKIFSSLDLSSTGRTESCVFDYEWKGKVYSPTSGKSWKTNREGMEILAKANRLYATKNALRYKLYINDYPVMGVTNIWIDTVGVAGKIYVVQTDIKAIQRCILMATDPGDLILDPTCGSGTTAYVAEQWGRRWVTCDTSRVAITLTKQRLMTAVYDYYELLHPGEGVGSGFRYKTVSHITLGSITNNEPPGQETLNDKPLKDKSRARVPGPFTVEAVPAPVVLPLGELPSEPVSDVSIARTGETLRQSQWREELLQTGIRAKGGQRIAFTRVEPLTGTRWLHAEAETCEDQPQRAFISFGSAFAPLEQRQVELALEEASHLVPRPKMVVFAAFQFDAEASKDIDETRFPGVTLLKAQMNTDLLTEDLKKKRSSNESFWLIGQPDVRLVKIVKGKDAGKYQVEVAGFDYYDPRTGTIESGGVEKIALWMLDTDYDRRAIFPRQVFFPMAGKRTGGRAWRKTSKLR